MEFASELPALIPSGGLLVALVWLMAHLLRTNSGDRSDYQTQLRALRKVHADDLRAERADHAEEIRAITARYEHQIEDQRNQLTAMEARAVELQKAMELERRARWKAEDAAAKYRRLVGQNDGSQEGT